MITKKTFKSKLLLVSEKEATAKDFEEYLCGELDLSILVNKKRTTFLELCEKIKGRKIIIKELELYRKENNCINKIILKYNRVSIF